MNSNSPILFVLILFIIHANATVAQAQRIESFTIATVDGKPYSLDEQKNIRALVLTFFTTFCKPCSQEHPHLEVLFKKYRDDGLHVIAVSADEPGNKSKVRLWVRRYRLSFPVLLDSQSELTRRYNPDLSFPLTLVIDSHRNVRAIFQGYTPGDEKSIEREVLRLLGREK